MKITNRMFNEVAERARYNLINDVKHRHETHEIFLSRCWCGAFMDLLTKSGVSLDVELPIYDETVIEPLD